MGQNPIHRPICRRSGKQTYRTREGALASILTSPNLHVYRCHHCNLWHLTSQPRVR